MDLSPQRLIDLAVRLSAYQGIVAARPRVEEQSGPVGVNSDGVRHVEPTAVGIAADPIFSTVFDYGGVVE